MDIYVTTNEMFVYPIMTTECGTQNPQYLGTIATDADPQEFDKTAWETIPKPLGILKEEDAYVKLMANALESKGFKTQTFGFAAYDASTGKFVKTNDPTKEVSYDKKHKTAG